MARSMSADRDSITRLWLKFRLRSIESGLLPPEICEGVQNQLLVPLIEYLDKLIDDELGSLLGLPGMFDEAGEPTQRGLIVDDLIGLANEVRLAQSIEPN